MHKPSSYQASLLALTAFLIGSASSVGAQTVAPLPEGPVDEDAQVSPLSIDDVEEQSQASGEEEARPIVTMGGVLNPFVGNIDPFGGSIDPFGGSIDPFGGSIDPFGGSIDPFGGTINPFHGEIRALWGTIDPFGGSIDPFGGTIDPFGGTIDPFYGNTHLVWSYYMTVEEAISPTEWLNSNVPGFSDLEDKERCAIADFLLLWSLFESKFLDTNGNSKRIRDAVEAWNKAGKLDVGTFDQELAYFRDRYYKDGNLSNHFEQLRLRNSDFKPMVQAVIDGSNDDPQACLASMLIIVYRYRNNLFHGEKWNYLLKGQFNNFTTANNLMMKLMTLCELP